MRIEQLENYYDKNNILLRQINGAKTEKTCQGQPPAPKTPPEIASFMAKLGLSPTNSREGDDALITAKLAEIKDPEKAAALQAEYASLVSSIGAQKTSANNQQQQDKTPMVDAFTAMNQLGAVNKLLLM